jgi:hypothetical protein
MTATVGDFAVLELPTVVGPEVEMAAEVVAEADAEACEGQALWLARQSRVARDLAAVEKYERIELILRLGVPERAGAAQGGAMQFVDEHQAVVAVGLALFVAAQITRASEAELLAAEEIGAGELRGGPGDPRETLRQRGQAFEF